MAVKVGTVKIDKSALMNAVGKTPGMFLYFTQAARAAADEELLDAKEQMLEFFDNHDITQEIKAELEAESKFLPYGNLFSFLGFDAGSDPTDNLRQALEDNVRNAFEPSKYVNAKLGIYRYYFNVLGPDREDIKDYTAGDLDRWSVADSWVYQVEEGISNLNKYLYDASREFPQSASGPAIQVKGEINKGAEFGGTPYLSEVINFLRQTLNA